MNRKTVAGVLLSCCVILAAHVAQGQETGNDFLIRKGMRTFRFNTFGDEAWWCDTLQLHKAIEGAKFGGTVRASAQRQRSLPPKWSNVIRHPAWPLL